MAPLPPESTARVYLDYTTCGYQHTLICRFKSGATIQDAVDQLSAFVTGAGTQVYASALVGLRASNDGSNITYPLANTFPTTWGSGSASGNESANYYDFVGRSADGRRVRVALFGAVNVSVNDLFRITGVGSAPWSDMLAALTDNPDVFCTISEQTPVWHNYVNTGINAYWRNTIR